MAEIRVSPRGSVWAHGERLLGGVAAEDCDPPLCTNWRVAMTGIPAGRTGGTPTAHGERGDMPSTPYLAIRWVALVSSAFLVIFNLVGLPYPGLYDNVLIAVSFVFNGLIIWQAWTWNG